MEAGVSQSGRAGLWSAVAEVAWKELRVEWRSRYALSASVLFAVVTLVAITVSLGPAAARGEAAAALLWIVLLFAATAALGHSYGREVDGGTWDFLRQNAAPSAVLFGKWLGALAVLLPLEAFILLLGSWLSPPVVGHPVGFAAILLLGGVSLALALPLVSAVLLRSRRHGGLTAALAFPLVLPSVLASVLGTRRAFAGEWPDGEVRLLLAFTGVLLIAGWILFEHLFED